MPRFSRNFIESNFYHVMIQGINKECIFKDDYEKKYFIYTLNKIKNDNKLNIITYCIMDNHAHLLLEVNKTKELIRFMQRINTKYAMYYNKKNDRVGHVFRDRYRSEGIFSEKQLYNCINYILNNPVKAGICNKAVDYKYSNYFENKKYILEDFQIKEDFIDIKENVNEEEVIFDYLKKVNLNFNYIKRNKVELKKIVKYLRDKKLSYRSIEKILDMSREKIRKLNRDYE